MWIVFSIFRKCGMEYESAFQYLESVKIKVGIAVPEIRKCEIVSKIAFPTFRNGDFKFGSGNCAYEFMYKWFLKWRFQYLESAKWKLKLRSQKLGSVGLILKLRFQDLETGVPGVNLAIVHLNICGMVSKIAFPIFRKWELECGIAFPGIQKRRMDFKSAFSRFRNMCFELGFGDCTSKYMRNVS